MKHNALENNTTLFRRDHELRHHFWK